MSEAVRWPDAAEEVFGADQTLAAGYVTPAKGVVLLPLTNTDVRDRATGRMTAFTTSVGFWPKLLGIQANPQIAIAFHTRVHGTSDSTTYALVQGRATVPEWEDRTWLDSHRDAWERFAGPRDVGIWERPMAVYHWRVPVEMQVERVLAWPDLACQGQPELTGAPLPDAPAPQSPPKNGTGPRVNHEKAAKLAAGLPNVLLAWVGGDGFPVIVPVTVEGAEKEGIRLTAPPGLVPPGGRRAGLLAHWVAKFSVGQHQRRYTGWMDADGDSVLYAPHTKGGYRLPSSKLLYKAAASAATRRGLRHARRLGHVAGG